MNLFRYENAGISLKVLVTFFLFFVGTGYIFGLINIHNNVGFSYTGIAVHYRGSEKEATVPPDFAFSKMIQEHHVHVFGMSIVFFLVGFLFVMTALPERVKALIVMMPFVGMFMDFGSIWLVAFQSAVFGWVAITFGALMAISFFFILGRPLYEMWVLPIVRKNCGETIPWYLS